MKVKRILTDGGSGEPDYSECETAGDVLDEAWNAMDVDSVAPVFLECEDGWYVGEMTFQFEPILKKDAPDDNFRIEIEVDDEEE